MSNVVLLCCVISFAFVGILSLKSGPFTSTLIRIENCRRTEVTTNVSIELYNSSTKENLLRGNFSVLKSDTGLTLSVHDYFLAHGQWQLTYSINDLSCRSYLVSTMGKLFGISFNKKTCAVPKGTYTFSNMDFDIVDHVYAITRDYGNVLRVVEVKNKKEIVVCLEFEFVVTPKKK